MLQTWLERAIKLRQLLNQLYDVIDKQPVHDGGDRVTANNHAIGIHFYNTCSTCL